MTSYDTPADQSAVSLEDLEAYLARNTRDILAPVMPAQNRVTGMFQSGTSGAAPPPAHVEGEGQPTPTNPPADDDLDLLDVAADGAEDAEEVEEGAGERDASTSDADIDQLAATTPPAAQPPTTSDLIEVSPGQFMTKEAIQTALATRPPVVETELPPVAAVSTPVTTAVEPVPEITLTQEMLDDPELGPMYRVIQAQQAAIAQQSQQLAFVSDIAVSRAQEELGARVTAGLHKFQADKHLTDEQLADINQIAVRLNVMGSLSSGIDPITGAQVPRDPESAAYRAMDIAYWQHPTYRDQAIQDQITSRAKDSRRKQKLAGVSSGSGSVPRTTTVPSDRRGRENAAVTELRELMSPGSAEDN